jgi:hypothetical protein
MTTVTVYVFWVVGASLHMWLATVDDKFYDTMEQCIQVHTIQKPNARCAEMSARLPTPPPRTRF